MLLWSSVAVIYIFAAPVPKPPADTAGFLYRLDNAGDLSRAAHKWSQLPLRDLCAVVAELALHLASTETVPIIDYEDSIVPYRVALGECRFQGHGAFVRQDPVIVGGRAAWGLQFALDMKLPELHAGLSDVERQKRVAEIKKLVAAKLKTLGDAQR